MPGPDVLPAGPHRDFLTALHDLYREAGKPGVRIVSNAIKKRDYLPDTLSHEMISAILRGDRLPRWTELMALVHELANRPARSADVDAILTRFHDLWAAVGSENASAVRVEQRANEITVGAVLRVPARSGYLAQVSRIAPASLRGRDEELAVLAAFCTAEDPAPSYLWWRASAWAGKSALMAWFALHPPPSVRVIPFFVTGRFAGQSDRAAFAEVVVEQLAEILGEPLRPLVSVARDAVLLDMFSRAANLCRQRGERLVLLVDGLDEDRRFDGSIAAMLPVRPVEGMRVVVTARSHSPVPDDVPSHHPLRDPAVVRDLAPSPDAVVIRVDAQRELAALLRGSPSGQELVASIAASGGGLTIEELAELTGRPTWEIAEQLDGTAGRTLAASRGQWRTDSIVYIFAHEDLQVRTIERLGSARLAAERERIHTWAERYRDQGWPQSTPEYLFRGYFALLRSIDDTTRLLRCATDLPRHDRMLDVSGGDYASLIEVTVGGEAIAAEPPTAGLTTAALLALHRDELMSRNAHIPVNLPGVWVRLGHVARAESLAFGIPSAERRDEALSALALRIAEGGDSSRALTVAGQIRDGDHRHRALRGIARITAHEGDLAEAEAILISINDPVRRDQALEELVRTALKAGDDATARHVTRSIGDMAVRSSAYLACARWATVLCHVGDARHQIEAAVTAAEQVDDPGVGLELLRNCKVQQLTLEAVIRAVADSSEAPFASIEELDSTRDRGDALVQLFEAMLLFQQPGAPDVLRQLVTAVADLAPRRRDRILIEAFDIAVQHESWEAARHALREIGERPRRAELLGDLARAGGADPQTITDTLTAVADIPDPYLSAQAYATFAESVAAADGHDWPADALLRAEAVALTIVNQHRRAAALGAVAKAAARIGQLDRAEQVARLIVDSDHLVEVLTEILAYIDDPFRSAGLAGQAEDMIHSLGAAPDRAAALADLADVLCQHDQPEASRRLAAEAERMARSVREPGRRVAALLALADALRSAGDPVRADHVSDLARQAMPSVVDPYRRLTLLVRLNNRVDYLEEVAELVASLTPDGSTSGLVLFAGLLAENGQQDRAETVALGITDPQDRSTALQAIGSLDAAAEAALEVRDPDRRALSLALVARQMLAGGQTEAAVVVLADIAQAAADIRDPHLWAPVAAALAEPYTRIHGTAAAMALAAGVSDPAHRVTILTAATSMAQASGAAALGQQLIEAAREDGRSIADPHRQSAILGDLAAVVARNNDLRTAGEIALSIGDRDGCAAALTRLAEAAPKTQAVRLLNQALARGDWTIALPLAGRVDQRAIHEVARRYLGSEYHPPTTIATPAGPIVRHTVDDGFVLIDATGDATTVSWTSPSNAAAFLDTAVLLAQDRQGAATMIVAVGGSRLEGAISDVLNQVRELGPNEINRNCDFIRADLPDISIAFHRLRVDSLDTVVLSLVLPGGWSSRVGWLIGRTTTATVAATITDIMRAADRTEELTASGT